MRFDLHIFIAWLTVCVYVCAAELCVGGRVTESLVRLQRQFGHYCERCHRVASSGIELLRVTRDNINNRSPSISAATHLQKLPRHRHSTGHTIFSFCLRCCSHGSNVDAERMSSENVQTQTLNGVESATACVLITTAKCVANALERSYRISVDARVFDAE